MSDAHDLKKKAALASIAASALLTVGKLVAGLLSGSLALLSEAGHGLLDTGATILTYFAVRISGKPADDEHHYGHGKVEAVAALAETGLLIVLSFFVVVEAARRLIGHAAEPVDASWPVFAVLVVSIVVDFVRWRSLKRIAEDTKSDALAADALHFSSDLVASACVLVGLIAVEFGFVQGDALAAIGVAGFIAVAGYKLGRRTIDTLMDAAPQGMTTLVRESAEAVNGVVNVDSVRLRPAGAQIFGEVGIMVPRTMPLERVAQVKQDVADAIIRVAPDANVTITANPIALDNESVLELVLLIAARRRLAVHHVTVQEISGVKSISLDLELDGRMSLGRAHDIATSLEEAIQAELGPDVEVETHVEPLEVAELAGRDVTQEGGNAIAAVLAQAAASEGIISDVHNVRVRETASGLVINYHCRASQDLSVDEVHTAVDHLDRRLRQSIPNVARVVGHAEPLR
jgi:cation diffusion facilitator family transporter